jgi:hypothetical protein
MITTKIDAKILFYFKKYMYIRNQIINLFLLKFYLKIIITILY